MFSEYLSLSELINGFSFPSEAVSEIGLVILIGFLLTFLGLLLRGARGAFTSLTIGAFLYVFQQDIPLSWLLQ